MPVPYADLTDPQTLNQYSYVRDLPTTRADIDGHGGPGVLEEIERVTQAAVDKVAKPLIESALEGAEVAAGTAVRMATGAVGIVLFSSTPAGDPNEANYLPHSGSSNKNSTRLGQARGADEDKSQSDDAKDRARTNGALVKLPKGKGSVPKDQRDSKRVWTKSENDKKLDQQKGLCAKCGNPSPPGKTRGHHMHRHADGARTVDKEHAVVCDDCHKEIHR